MQHSEIHAASCSPGVSVLIFSLVVGQSDLLASGFKPANPQDVEQIRAWVPVSLKLHCASCGVRAKLKLWFYVLSRRSQEVTVLRTTRLAEVKCLA